ncbi:MAG: DUF4252 domain-containing protein [Bacteroidales bacterium]|jgi:hypothetical protein|nr:DUF4252 domain-containing protein [Bacteroidales bacterium]
MKRMVLLCAMAFFALALNAQKDALDDFFASYSGKDGYTSVIINGNLFGLLKNFDDDPDLADMDERITSVRIVTRESDYESSGVSFMSELKGDIRRGGYEELMSVKDSDDDVLFLVKSSGKTVTELLVIASGDSEAVIQIKGKLTRDDVERLSYNHGEGLARLELLESSGK